MSIKTVLQHDYKLPRWVCQRGVLILVKHQFLDIFAVIVRSKV